MEAGERLPASGLAEEATIAPVTSSSEPSPAGTVELPPLPLAEVRAGVEALLYASPEPLSVKDLRKLFPEGGELVRPALDGLRDLYQQEGRGLQIVEVAGGFQITTRPEVHEVVSRLVASPKPARLTLQALETLAVIAYRQPITVPEIMDLRGVRSASVVRTLLEKKLVKILGRKNVVGRPLMYGTTKEFLLRFGLKDVKDLPQLKDMSEVFGEDVAQQLEVLEGLPAVENADEAGGAEPESWEASAGGSGSESESETENVRAADVAEAEAEAEAEPEADDDVRSE
jgi:segregation and condensation protein B